MVVEWRSKREESVDFQHLIRSVQDDSKMIEDVATKQYECLVLMSDDFYPDWHEVANLHEHLIGRQSMLIAAQPADKDFSQRRQPKLLRHARRNNRSIRAWSSSAGMSLTARSPIGFRSTTWTNGAGGDLSATYL